MKLSATAFAILVMSTLATPLLAQTGLNAPSQLPDGKPTLVGDVVPGDRISGEAADEIVVIGFPDAARRALYGIESRERSDNPCWFRVMARNITVERNRETSSDTDNDLCGKKPTSSTLSVAYPRDGALGADVFIKGVAVCMNNRGDRIKGLAIKPARLQPDGTLTALWEQDMREDDRFNCGTIGFQYYPDGQAPPPRSDLERWQAWSECPPGHLATALELHHEMGNTPRSVSGIRVLCRLVEPPPAPRPITPRRGG